jgi:hypothetical protein
VIFCIDNFIYSTVYIYQNTHKTLTNTHITKPTHTHTHTHAHECTGCIECALLYNLCLLTSYALVSQIRQRPKERQRAAPNWLPQCSTLPHALHIRVIEQNGNLKFCLWAFSLLVQKRYCVPDPAVFSWERKLSIYSIWTPGVRRNTLGSCIHGAVNHMDSAGSGRSFEALETG